MTPMLSRAYYGASVTEFLLAAPAAVLGELVAHHTFAVDENQRNAWQSEIAHLQEVAKELPDGFFFLEFAIPRMGKRADVIIIAGGHVFVIEYKVGADDHQKHAIDQVLASVHDGCFWGETGAVIEGAIHPGGFLPAKVDLIRSGTCSWFAISQF